MRPTRNLLAIIYKNAKPLKGSGQYLTPYNPTGLTGLSTHPYPRPTLIHIYTSTLQVLAQLPTHSVYRQATEALTKQRLAVVENTRPPGFEEWQRQAEELLQQHPQLANSNRSFKTTDGSSYLLSHDVETVDDRVVEWDNDSGASSMERGEGPRTIDQRRAQAREFGEGRKAEDYAGADITVTNEPPLTSDQINAMEQQIGAGLIEEVIAVAQGELHLAQVMAESKAWEELEEKPVEDQWKYFARDRHVPVTQKTP